MDEKNTISHSTGVYIWHHDKFHEFKLSFGYSQYFEISCIGKHAPRDTYDFATHFGGHVAQIWFLHIKSLGNQSMYKNGWMMSVFLF